MVTTLRQLSQKINLDLSDKLLGNCWRSFSLLAPESFISRIRKRDINDPLLLQILPQKLELENIPGFSSDPLEEKKYSPVPGLIHKYYGRVLLLATNVCAINCRFCFRRYLRETVGDWSRIFSYLEHDSTINEVILSGGDPLMLKPQNLRSILQRIHNIPHIKRIRIHTRIPVVMPERINIKLFPSKVPLTFVIHCNHPNEINPAVKKALHLLRRRGSFIFNQTVLLRSINDDAQTLITLNEKLFETGVIPYYIHIMDKVKGAAHFYVGIKKAKKIYSEMKKKLPGYLMPKLVVERKKGKVFL